MFVYSISVTAYIESSLTLNVFSCQNNNCLSVSQSGCPFARLSTLASVHPFIYLYCNFNRPLTIYLTVCMYVSVSLCLYINPSIHPSIHPPLCLSCLSILPSICLMRDCLSACNSFIIFKSFCQPSTLMCVNRFTATSVYQITYLLIHGRVSAVPSVESILA